MVLRTHGSRSSRWLDRLSNRPAAYRQLSTVKAQLITSSYMYSAYLCCNAAYMTYMFADHLAGTGRESSAKFTEDIDPLQL